MQASSVSVSFWKDRARRAVSGFLLFGLLYASSPVPLTFAAAPLTASFSSTAPTQPANTAQNPIPVSITFSEDVTNFGPASLNVSNGSVVNFATTTASVYTFGIVPAAPSGSVSVDLNGNQVLGIDGQPNQAANQIQFIYNSSAGDATTTATSTSPVATSTPPVASSTPPTASTTPATGPSLTITSGPGNGSFTNQKVVTFGFTTDPGATTQCFFGALFTCGSPLTLGSTTSPLGDSFYTLSLTATNASSTASTTVSTTFTVDTIAPVVNEVTPVASSSANQTPAYSFISTKAGTLALGGGCSTAATSTLAAATSTISLVTLSPGSYSACTLVVTDAAGNPSNALTLSPFTITAPASSGDTGSTPSSGGSSGSTGSGSNSGSSGGGGGGIISGPLAIGYQTPTQPAPAPTTGTTANSVATSQIPDNAPTTSTNTGNASTITNSTGAALTDGSANTGDLALAQDTTPPATTTLTPATTSTTTNTQDGSQAAAAIQSGFSTTTWVWITLLLLALLAGGFWYARTASNRS